MIEPSAVHQLAAALRYAALGWQVIPLHTPSASGCSCGEAGCVRSSGKHPRFKDWVKRATTDQDAIKGWWRTWPAANVGLVTGARSGFFVLDVDPEKNGEVTLAMLCAEHGQLPPTVEALTGSGGRHLLFRYPGHLVPNSTSRLGPGLDVRGDGGQIVAAPSTHFSGGTYEWQPERGPGTAIADAPAWLLELLKPAPPPPRQRPTAADSALRRASAYLAKIPGAVSGDNGHGKTWSAALAVVRGFRLSEGEAIDLLLSEYNPRCDPPWSEKEITHKVTQALNNASVPFGYLLDAERSERSSPPPRGPAATPAAPPSNREPGSDDGDELPAPTTTPATPQTRLNLQPVSVLLAEVIPDTDWLLAPWLEAGTIAAVVAPPNLGKTLLAFYFATLVASADQRVAIIEEEGSRRGFQKRVSRAVRAIGTEKCHSIDWTFKPRLNLLRRSDVESMATELAGYRLVIIDSFARVTVGVEENDAKEMGELVEILDRLREATGACILLVHHTGKSKWKAGEVPSLSDGRGSSALAAGLDTMLNLAEVEEKEPGIVQFDLHVTKQRDEERVTPQRIRITMTGPEATVTLDGDSPARAKVPSAAEQKTALLLDPVLRAIPLPPDAPVTREDLQEKIGKRASDVRAAVNQLIDQGKVRELSRKRLIRVPSAPVPSRSGERSE